jgi:hypothetical protein
MIDLKSESLLTLGQAAQRLPRRRRGRPVNISTVFRWIAHGIRGVRLEGIRVGGAIHTSEEALQRFADRLTDVSQLQAVSPSSRSRLREIEQANTELKKLGF